MAQKHVGITFYSGYGFAAVAQGSAGQGNLLHKAHANQFGTAVQQAVQWARINGYTVVTINKV